MIHSIALPRSVYQTLVEHARASLPQEACGILSGLRGQVLAFHAMNNTDASAEHFMMDPREQFAVAKALRAAGQEMVAIHHSHPTSPARPSVEDIRLANTPGVAYTILSLERPGAPELKAFTIADGQVAELPVSVIPDAVGPAGHHEDEPFLRLPARVLEDAARYGTEVARFERGEVSAAAFRAFRVPMGVYEHRQEGHFMVRIRLGAGLARPYQLERIAQLSQEHGNRVVHVTTRQDLQIHGLSLDKTAVVQEGLLEVGLSGRGGGGNTVRNVTACPRASVCPKAVFDVAPHAIATAEYLLQNPGSFNLPRKYKIAFSGCTEDCSFASVQDLGFFAHLRGGQAGFAVYAGGGLGSHPRVGVQLEEYLPAEQAPVVAEAIRRVFDRLGDRTDKHRARLRFVLQRLGPEGFSAEYRAERAALERDGHDFRLPAVRPLPVSITGSAGAATHEPVPDGFLPERDPSRLTLQVQLSNGDIPAPDLYRVANIARNLGANVVVASQQQELLVPGIAKSQAASARAALAGLSIAAQPRKPRIVACAGASTCKLGLCHSPALARALESRLAEVDTTAGPSSIRISGCANACGNHLLAGLGLEGRARRHQGRLMPLYEVLLSGSAAEGQARLGERLGGVPARRVPDLLAEIYQRGLTARDELRALVRSHSQIPSSAPDELYFDLGSDEPFSLAGRGPGECGAGVMDVIQVDLNDADAALARADETSGLERSEHLYRALASAARSLLPIFGIDARKDREVFQAVSQHLITPCWVSADSEGLLAAALDWRLGDRLTLEDLRPATRQFVQRIRDLFASLDASLQFRLPRVARDVPPPANAVPAKVIDLRGVACPLNFVKAKMALGKVAVGHVLEVLLDAGAPAENVPPSLAEPGHEVLSMVPEGTFFHLKVKRRK